MAPPKRNVVERFLEKVEKTNSCWNWKARKDQDGYGEFQFNNQKQRAHRVAFLLFKEKLLPSQLLRHTCDNPSCVNPDHLLPGTSKENKLDSISRLRHARTITHGMTKLSQEQIDTIRQDPRRQVDIAADYSISQSHVSRIKRRENWATL